MLKYLVIFVLFFSIGYSQDKYPKGYFDSPLKIPIIFSGTFGELRSNHFHSGIDIKTQQKEGIPIYAPADGYVYRVKLKQYGYGKALYVRHPNGYSTVYGHLQKFNDTIQKYVKSVQYKNKKYAFNEYFKANKFPVKRGDIIGYTGDTGGSGGPHLHYEIRDSKTEHVINPMHFGVTTADTKSPKVNKIMVFPIDELSRVNNSSNKFIIPIKKVKTGSYTAKSITANGTIGFGINVFDQQNLAKNKNGIYSLEMKLNGQRVYYHDVETFSFSESKYINLLIDYEYYKKYKSRFQRTHRVKNNALSMYEDLVDDGKIYISPNENYSVEIIAKDFHGNKSTVTIPIVGVKGNAVFKEKDTTSFKIARNKFTKFAQGNVTAAFPKKAVYKDAFINFKVSNDTAYIHKPTIPLHKKFTLTFSTSHLTPYQKKKVYIANVTKRKYPYLVSSRKKDTTIYATTKNFGTYTLKFDEKKPKISLVNFKNGKWISANKTLKVKIRDYQTGIRYYKATIDGQWILMQLNHKTRVLTYDFSDKKLVGDKHVFKISVYDNVGNVATKQVTFFRKDGAVKPKVND